MLSTNSKQNSINKYVVNFSINVRPLSSFLDFEIKFMISNLVIFIGLTNRVWRESDFVTRQHLSVNKPLFSRLRFKLCVFWNSYWRVSGQCPSVVQVSSTEFTFMDAR